MSLERIWACEKRRRKTEALRRMRVKNNWPDQASRIARVFRSFAEIASEDGIYLYVYEDSGEHGQAFRKACSYSGSVPWGNATVSLVFANDWLDEGELKKTDHGVESIRVMEFGARLIVHCSESEGVIQVFLDPPYRGTFGSKSTPARDLLIGHTYNPDDLTERWAKSQIKKLLVLNRVESVFYRPRAIDKIRTRLWRFLDVRNRRGYLESFRHLFTPWELLVVTVLAFAVGLLFPELGD